MARHLIKALLLIGFIAYQILLHTYIRKEGVEMSQLVLAFVPMLTVAAWVVFRLVPRIWWPLLLLVIAAITYFIVHGNYGRTGLLAVDGTLHASLNLFLLWVFGRTLLPGQIPLISQISSLINGHLEPHVAIYTRQVTVAWCIFFMLQVITSLVLYVFASITVWSFFINVMNMPLLITMFVVEHAIRKIRIPNRKRTSIQKAIEVYTKNFTTPNRDERKL